MIKKYNKKPIKVHDTPLDRREITVKNEFNKGKHTPSLWEILAASYTSLINYLSISKFAGFLVPAILIIIGLSILSSQFWPKVVQNVQKAEGYLDQGTTSLVEPNYVEERQIQLSDPGSEYFQRLKEQAFSYQNTVDEVSQSYNKEFYISLPSIDLYDLKVTPNVDSGNEDVYQDVLEKTLAHMDGTGLPISEVGNKTVIYGHSSNNAGGSDHPSVAFSRLQELEIGDEIIIKMEDTEGQMREFKYRVNKTQIVNPTDVELIRKQSSKKQLMGITCYPNGDSAFRFIFEAKLIEDNII